MSSIEQSISSHDMYVGLAVRIFTSDFGGEVHSIDGRVIHRDLIKPFPPIINGYKPDAIISHRGLAWLVEAKSIEDIYSAHSAKQFRIVRNLLDQNVVQGFFLFIYGRQSERVLRIPPEISAYQNTNRLIVMHIPLKWKDYEEEL
jgi:hypothetical protein